jgi:plastocyanin
VPLIIQTRLIRLLPAAAVLALAGGIADAAGEAKVSIRNFMFGPPAVTIQAGDGVTWSNDDAATHTVTFKDGSAGAKSLTRGQTFTRVFDKTGTFEYFCSIHPQMTGRVVVGAQ